MELSIDSSDEYDVQKLLRTGQAIYEYTVTIHQANAARAALSRGLADHPLILVGGGVHLINMRQVTSMAIVPTTQEEYEAVKEAMQYHDDSLPADPYPYEDESQPPPAAKDLTVKDLKALLDKAGVPYESSDRRARLETLAKENGLAV